jgi:hypothetical protein
MLKPKVSQIDALFKSLKEARAPSRQLDREILRVVSGRIVRDETFVYGPKDGTHEIETVYPYRWSCLFAPRYTRSFEVALTLLPKLVYVEVSGGTYTGEGMWPAVSIRWLRPGETDQKKWMGTVQGAPSFALAMCRAAIEVRVRMEKEP